MLAEGAGNIVYAASALQTEALAAYMSLQHASQLSMMNIILETDAAVLASALKSEEIDRSPIGSLAKQIRDIGPVRLSCEPYCFSEGKVFFSHNKSANSTFSHGFSAKRKGPLCYLNLIPV